MARSTGKPKPIRKIRHEVQALVRFVPWVLLSLLFVLLVWHADIAALSGLFQSSPVDTPTAPPRPPNTPTPPPTNTPTPMVDTTPVITATLTPTPTIAVTLTPTPTLTVTPTLTASPTPTPTVTLIAPTETVTPTLTDTGRQRYPGDTSSVAFEWGMLFDSVALGLSYVWLGCGILVFVSIPVAFAVLWVASRRRQRPLE